MLWEELKGNIFKRSLPFLILIFTAHGLMTTTYIMSIFKNQRLDPSHFHYPEILSGKVNPYQYFNLSQSLQKSQCRYVYTLLYWAKIKHKNINPEYLFRQMQPCSSIISTDPYFQVDQVYLFIETAFEFPVGHSFLNDPSYVSLLTHQTGEPP